MKQNIIDALNLMLSRESGELRDNELDGGSRHWMAMAGLTFWCGGNWVFISNFGRNFVEDKMGVQINSDGKTACLYCGCSGWAFGPIFEGEDPEQQALNFLEWIGCDPRHLPEDLLRRAKGEWHRTHLKDDALRTCPLSDERSIAVLREIQQEDHEWTRLMSLDALRQRHAGRHAAPSTGAQP